MHPFLSSLLNQSMCSSHRLNGFSIIQIHEGFSHGKPGGGWIQTSSNYRLFILTYCMKERRQVGFIKTYSNKALEPFRDEPSEFSYFRLRNRREDEEFSPYKLEPDDPASLKRTLPAPRPPLPVPTRRPEDLKKSEGVLEKLEAVQRKSAGQSDRAKADQLYDRIKQNIASYEQRKNNSKGKLQENIGSIRNKIEELDSALKELKVKKESQEKERETRVASKNKISYKFEEDSDSSSSEESEEVVIKSIPSPKVSQAKQELRRKEDAHLPSHHSQKSKEKSLSKPAQSEDSEEDESEIYDQAQSPSQPSIAHTKKENVVTFNSRSRNHAPLQIEEYTSSSEEQQEAAIKPSFTIPNRRVSQEEDPRSQLAAKEFYKNKGGVCFDIDVKEFAQSGPPLKDERVQRPKKAQKVDKRSELLKRREAAKVYDKMARRALFSAYN